MIDDGDDTVSLSLSLALALVNIISSRLVSSFHRACLTSPAVSPSRSQPINEPPSDDVSRRLASDSNLVYRPHRRIFERTARM